MFAFVVPFGAGVLMALGLVVSGMARPAEVLGFLDISGDWRPALALVMAAAIGVHFVAYRLKERISNPLLGGKFCVPSRRDIDARLVFGALIFGTGWGITGICPGPALLASAGGQASAMAFTAALVAGMVGFRVFDRALASMGGGFVVLRRACTWVK